MEPNTNPNIVEIPISQEVIDYVQLLDFDISGLKVLHGHALSREDVSEEKCDKIKEEFLGKYKELELVKAEIEKEYLSEVPFKSWQINFNRSIIVCHV